VPSITARPRGDLRWVAARRGLEVHPKDERAW